MDSKDYPTILKRCILCCRIDYQNIGFINIDTKQMASSKKTLKSVLIDLNKCIKKDYNFDFYACVCSSCFEKVAEYDEIMVQLLIRQEEIGCMLEESMKKLRAYKIENEIVEDSELGAEELGCETESLKEEVASVSSVHSDDKVDEQSEKNLSQESKNNLFPCTICKNVLKSKGALQTHLKRHAKLVSCSICGAVSKNEEYLELHMNIHEGKTENECRYCPKKYKLRCHVVRHMHFHWDKKKLQCEKCGLRFSQASILYDHKLNHEAEEKPFVCGICNRTFKSKRILKNHSITHLEDRPMYPCEFCGKIFTQKYTIKAHLKTHADGYEHQAHPNPTKKIKSSKKNPEGFACIICDTLIETKEALELHMVQNHYVIT